MAITVDGVRYKVVGSLGFQHSIGAYAKIVSVDGAEKMAVKFAGGPWRFWSPEDRVRPYREHLERERRRRLEEQDGPQMEGQGNE